MNCEQNRMLREISVLSFTIVELTLFLDTHPCNQEAMRHFDYYNRLKKEKCEELLQEEKDKFERINDAYSKLNKENRSLKKDYDKIIDSDLYKTYTDVESANKYLAFKLVVFSINSLYV